MSIESINKRIYDLNGVILSNNVQTHQNPLMERMLSIEFKFGFYLKPVDTPWAKAHEQEPIVDIGDFIEPLMPLYLENQSLFFQKIVDNYFPDNQLDCERCGQIHWLPKLFTPLTIGSGDYEEWMWMFTDEAIDKIKAFFQTEDNIEFLLLATSDGYPDTYFISLSDQNINNPTIYGTDRTGYFSEIDVIGSFEEFLNQLFTQDELIQTIKTALDNCEESYL
ncbi:hypothetical protein [Thorsellia anophelis]|uniref:Uncharacterized protein n=1 Tax=Thorsellia anophelis DSM 18579 TaxID=1123402 RepID=A0A1I0AQ14_9GAMM|nr:hypothetical protein [Thorsellia anophelis]SES96366.1 hypothetical protein SAMN02583745_01012 [Thorsellia anophelis DSM 18579]